MTDLDKRKTELPLDEGAEKAIAARKKEYKEKPNGTYKNAYIYKSWREHRPRRWKIISVQGSDNDYKSLKPHTNINNNRYNE